MPVEGHDGVLFPATFAAGDGFPGGYNIDGDANGANVCLIDTVGSQANRIEPLFAEEKYKSLVPQIVVEAGEKEVNLLEAGHRAGDAIVRCSELQQTLQDAFKAVLKGDATPLAKIAPTSLVFGVWDSRDTQAKLPRLIASTIRAFNVRQADAIRPIRSRHRIRRREAARRARPTRQPGTLTPSAGSFTFRQRARTGA